MLPPIISTSAVTLAVTNMEKSCAFYEELGFRYHRGGPTDTFTTLIAGNAFLNLQLHDEYAAPEQVWGRVIFWVVDVDAVYRHITSAGYEPDDAPSNAPWGERYFHIKDPDGHEISIARPLNEAKLGDIGSVDLSD